MRHRIIYPKGFGAAEPGMIRFAAFFWNGTCTRGFAKRSWLPRSYHTAYIIKIRFKGQSA